VTRASIAAALLLAALVGTADASDLKTLLKDVMPCRSAAVRLCDRSQGMDFAAVWRCGATLASHRHDVGPRCVEVLKRYGQLER
jgi:hypothetical protein